MFPAAVPLRPARIRLVPKERNPFPFIPSEYSDGIFFQERWTVYLSCDRIQKANSWRTEKNY